jgi:hypothetical protein
VFLRSAAALVLSLAWAAPATGQVQIGMNGPSDQTPNPVPVPGAPDSSMRVQVKPRDTQVFVDGYYAGIADNFDGTFQRLRLEPGQHTVQLFLPGHRLFAQDLYLQPGNTFTLRHTMERLREGEAEPAKPVGSPRMPRIDSGIPAPPIQTPPASSGAGPPSVAPRAAADAYGAVHIHVQPADFVMLIDGERWTGAGTDNFEVQLAAGPHTIEVRKAGYRGYLTEITIRSGETTGLNVSLTAER